MRELVVFLWKTLAAWLAGVLQPESMQILFRAQQLIHFAVEAYTNHIIRNSITHSQILCGFDLWS